MPSSSVGNRNWQLEISHRNLQKGFVFATWRNSSSRDSKMDEEWNSGAQRSGTKRSFQDLEEEDDEDDYESKKANIAPKETAPGEATQTILTLRKTLDECKKSLTTCREELTTSKSEVQKWHTTLQNEYFVPIGATPEPKYVLNYLQTLRSSEESLKEQLEKAKKKEAAFIVTFARREQEIAELKSAVRDLRAQLKPPSLQARRLLLDPAIHEEFTRLKNLVEEKDKIVKELKDQNRAISFTPTSKMGKMLMAKCKTLMEENEEIGNQANEGKIHELTMKLSLQKSQNAELRNHFEGLYKHINGLTNEAEKSNEMVLILQESLEEKDAEIQRLKDQLLQNTPAQDQLTDSAGKEKEIAMEANTKGNLKENVFLAQVKVEDKVDD